MSDLTTLLRLHCHNHFHCLDLNVRFTGLNLSPIFMEITDDLSSNIGTKFGGIEDVGHEDGGTIQHKTKAKSLVSSLDTVRLTTKFGYQRTIGGLSKLDIN